MALGAEGAEVWDNLGLAQRLLGEPAQALASFERAAAADPSLTPALANLVQRALCLVRMGRARRREQRLIATLDKPASDPRWSPWIALSMPLSPEQQLAVARRWPARCCRRPRRAARLLRAAHGGCASVICPANFRDHPTGRLMAGLFEQHDRSRFEIFGYSYGRRSRQRDGRTRARGVRPLARRRRAFGDAEAARMIRDDGDRHPDRSPRVHARADASASSPRGPRRCSSTT